MNFAIVGGGPAGCLMAILLARRGHQVQVFERRGDPRQITPEAGRSINLALAARGKRALAEAGVLDALLPHMVPMPGRALHLPDGSATFSAYGQNPGETNHSISRAELTRQLVLQAGREPRVTLQFRQRCQGLAAHGALQLRDEEDGREYAIAADRIIGADGAGSALRKALAASGEVTASNELLDHDYKELNIPARDGRSALAMREALHIWPRHNFMLIALPNADHSFTATLFMPREGEPGFTALAAPGAVRALFEREFPDVLALMPDLEAEFAAHPQGILGTVRCSPWNAGERLVLIGDASHAIVPFHGQGLNCALEDCRLLDEMLGSDEPEPFARFAAHRLRDANAIAQMSLENYGEMRDDVTDPRHHQRRGLELALERRHPGRFIPRYAMVMFHDDIPYSTALARGDIQHAIIEELLDAAGDAGDPQDPRNLEHADALIAARLPPLH